MFRRDEMSLGSSRMVSSWFGQDEAEARQLVELGAREFFKIQSNSAFNKQELEYHAYSLYRTIGFGRPQIVICDSPQELIKEVTNYLNMTSCTISTDYDRHFRMFYHNHRERQGLLHKKFHDDLDSVSGRQYSTRLSEMVTSPLSELYRLLIMPCLSQTMTGEIGEFVTVNEIYRLMAKVLSIFCMLGRESSQHYYYRGRSYLGEEGVVESLVKLMTGSFFFVPLVDICFIVRKPTVFETEGLRVGSTVRLHNDQGPVLGFADNFEVYMYKNVQVPKYVIKEPEKITVTEIIGERNVELRRVKLERYGFSKFMLDAGAKVIDEYKGEVEGLKGAKLYEIGIGEIEETPERWSAVVETLKMISVIDCTPEDNERRVYFLRVPPNMRTAEQAVAWTWGLQPEQYQPIKES
jgi:hypothetical protein